MHGVDDKHCNWRVKNQVRDHNCEPGQGKNTRLHDTHAMSKQEGYVTEKVLRVPADIESDADAQRVSN